MRALATAWLAAPCISARADAAWVIGLNAAVSAASWTAPRAIEAGLRVAIDDINARGGVASGRMLRLEVVDHRGTTARSRENARALAARPEVVAMFCDSFSPTALDLVPLVHELRLPMLNPWAAADGIIDHGLRPSYTFRLSLRDSWVMPAVVRRAAGRRLGRLGMLALANSWGRSNEAALRASLAGRSGSPVLVGTERHALAESPAAMGRHVEALRAAGADAIVLVAAVEDSASLVQAVAALPSARRLPILSHWGLAAGDFFGICRAELAEVDLEVVQTFGLERAGLPQAARVLRAAAGHMGVDDMRRLPSVAGVVHAYDLAQLLARALDQVGQPDRVALRQSLEQLPPHEGLVRRLARPFSAERHEALAPDDLFMARFDGNGQLRRSA